MTPEFLINIEKLLEKLGSSIPDFYVGLIIVFASFFVLILLLLVVVLSVENKKLRKKTENRPRLYLPLEKQEEHDDLAQIMNSHFMVICGGRENGKSQIMFPHPIGCEPIQTSKKCVNCKHFRFIVNYTVHSDKPHKNPICCVKDFDSSKIYRFNKCEDFKEKISI